MGRGCTFGAATAVLAMVFLVAAAGGAAATDPTERFAPDELIVRYQPGVDRDEQAAIREELGADLDERLVLPRAEVVDLPAEAGVLDMARAFERRPGVRYAEPNFTYHLDGVPDDPLFFEQAGLHDTGQTFGDLDQVPPTFTGTYDADVDAPEAWNIATGSPQVTIAIADTGVDYTHPDIAPNIVPGYDFGADDGDPIAEGSDHGTHVAGIAGAVGNNGFGVAGVSWQSKLMPLKVSNPQGTILAADLADAFAYAASRGVQVVNASLGGADLSGYLRNAINSAPGTLFVVSAGNSQSNIDNPLDLDPQHQQFPCEHDAPNIICVTSTNHNDELASSFANYGSTSVDLAAPGTSILSTVFASSSVYTGPFGFKSGTSMSTAMVSGTAALLFGLYPGASVAEVKAAILQNTDPAPSLAGITVTGGRLNVNRALGGSGELDVDTAITSGPKKKGHKRRVRFTFDSPTHHPASFLCQIDQKGFGPCVGIAKYKVKRGRHVFAVKAIDAVGREDPTPATRKFRVKPRGPERRK